MPVFLYAALFRAFVAAFLWNLAVVAAPTHPRPKRNDGLNGLELRSRWQP